MSPILFFLLYGVRYRGDKGGVGTTAAVVRRNSSGQVISHAAMLLLLRHQDRSKPYMAAAPDVSWMFFGVLLVCSCWLFVVLCFFSI